MEIEKMFIELIKGQTQITTEMRVRNDIDAFRLNQDERREVRVARFTWGVLLLAAFALGVKGLEYIIGIV